MYVVVADNDEVESESSLLTYRILSYVYNFLKSFFLYFILKEHESFHYLSLIFYART